MIDEYLAFARGEGGEAAETIDVRDLVETVADGAARAGAIVEVGCADRTLAPAAGRKR